MSWMERTEIEAFHLGFLADSVEAALIEKGQGLTPQISHTAIERTMEWLRSAQTAARCVMEIQRGSFSTVPPLSLQGSKALSKSVALWRVEGEVPVPDQQVKILQQYIDCVESLTEGGASDLNSFQATQSFFHVLGETTALETQSSPRS